jgi:hypothetical protein
MTVIMVLIVNDLYTYVLLVISNFNYSIWLLDWICLIQNETKKSFWSSEHFTGFVEVSLIKTSKYFTNESVSNYNNIQHKQDKKQLIHVCIPYPS